MCSDVLHMLFMLAWCLLLGVGGEELRCAPMCCFCLSSCSEPWEGPFQGLVPSSSLSNPQSSRMELWKIQTSLIGINGIRVIGDAFPIYTEQKYKCNM